MKAILTSVAAMLILGSACWATAQDAAKSDSKTTDESTENLIHKKFIGEWDILGISFDGTDISDPKPVGSEKAESFGENWVIASGEVQTPGGFPMSYRMTVGYDPTKKAYVGSWICNLMPDLWVYEGTVNESGTTLTLEAEGPNPAAGGKLTKFRDVTEWKDEDLRVQTSYMLDDSGTWVSFATAHYRRKK